MNGKTGFVHGNNWTYDPAVEIITILDATGRVVDQGWSICNHLESAQSDPSIPLIRLIEIRGENVQQVPCDAMTAVRLFLAGILTLEHLSQPNNERGRRIECRDVKIGAYERTVVILPI
jgi:hypothetical protein